MAGSGLPKASSSGPIQPLSRAPSRAQSFQRTASNRRVYFSEIPPKHQAHNWESGEDKKERRGCGLCCAWTSLIVGCIFLALLLLGALFLAYLQSALPEFRVKRLNINKLEVVSSNQQTLLNADFELLINATNKNDKYELSYGPMKVNISSEDIYLGMAEISPYHQNPHKVWEMKLQTTLSKSAVNGEDADALKSNYKSKQMVINLVFKGSISINFEGRKVNGLPLTVLCQEIEQSQIDQGLQPLCRVKMFSFL